MTDISNTITSMPRVGLALPVGPTRHECRFLSHVSSNIRRASAKWSGLILAGTLLLPATTAAQGQGPVEVDPADHSAAPVVSAIRLVRPVEIDGRLDDEIWTRGVPATRFIQNEPDEGTGSSEATDVRIAYDDDAIYVGAFMHDRSPVTTRLARRDGDLPDTDWFAVAFDSYHDHLTAYRFAVNPSGVRRDEIMTGASQFGGDTNWDPVWEAMTEISDSGWTVEMRIPFSQLRFSRQPTQTWGIQIERRIGRTREGAVVAYTPRNERGGVARYGHLVGLENIRADAGRLEVLPYALGRADYRSVSQNSDVSFGNPFRDGSLHARKSE